MGAVTALMYADRNHEIGCVVLDSPFYNLQALCKELVKKFQSGLSAFSGIALTFISKTIKEKVFDRIFRTTSISKILIQSKMSKRHSYQHYLQRLEKMILFCLITQINFMRPILVKSKKYQQRETTIPGGSKKSQIKYLHFSIMVYMLKTQFSLILPLLLNRRRQRRIKSSR